MSKKIKISKKKHKKLYRRIREQQDTLIRAYECIKAQDVAISETREQNNTLGELLDEAEELISNIENSAHISSYGRENHTDPDGFPTPLFNVTVRFADGTRVSVPETGTDSTSRKVDLLIAVLSKVYEGSNALADVLNRINELIEDEQAIREIEKRVFNDSPKGESKGTNEDETK
jgi:hypothetical protein